MVVIYYMSISPYQNSTTEAKLHYFKCYNSNELLKRLVVAYVMKLNKVHLCNLGLISDMVKKTCPDMYQPINILNRTIDVFNDYNASLRLKVLCTIDDIETNVGYFEHIEEGYQKIKSKISENHFRLDDIIKEEKILDRV